MFRRTRRLLDLVEPLSRIVLGGFDLNVEEVKHAATIR
jgi:hypothetical protein